MNTQRGVTLVELVVVLTLMGLVVSVGATLVGRVVAGQQDTRARLALAQAGDGALARISSEVEAALPNSLRVTANAAGTWVEWVPVQDGGRYRQAPDTSASGPGDLLDLDDASDNGFDVIGTPLASLAAGSQVVFAALGTPEADAYAGNNRRGGVTLSGGGSHVSFTAAGALPHSAGSARFFIVATPVTLACVAAPGGGQQLLRYAGYGWLAAQPVAAATLAGAGASVALLQGGLRSCSAAYGTALANIGLLTLRLEPGDSGTGSNSTAMATLLQIAVDNSP